ncbi:MAG: DMT family transporter [Desulfovibrionaceae bacterium]
MTPRSKGMLLAFAGICVLSPDTLLVRLLEMEQWSMQAWRGMGLAAGLSVVMLVIQGRRALSGALAVGLVGVLASATYAGSSLLFIASLYNTTVANTLAIISTAPLFGALMTRFFLKERLPRRTWGAIALSLAAICVIVGGGVSANPDYLAGDFMALAQAVLMAATFVIVRSRSKMNMLPCMILGGLIITAVSAPMAGTLAVPAEKLPLLFLLVLVVLPTSFGMLFVAPRYISAPEVNMIMLLEMVLGPLLVWALVAEEPPASTLVGGSLLLLALLGHSALALREQRLNRRRVGVSEP